MIKNNKRLFFLSILAIFSVLFNSAVISMAVVYIFSDLGSSSATASYATVFFGVGNVITIPLAIVFKERIGIPKFFLICQVCFIASTLLAGFATTYPAFIFYRFLQGLSSGPLFILLSTFLVSKLEDPDKPKVLRFNLTSFIVAPIIGASWGGWIGYDYNWRHIFTINAILMIIITVALFRELRRFPVTIEKKPFDTIGYISFIIGFFSLSFFITLGQELDWFRSNLMTISFFTGLIFLIYFVLRSLNHSNPIFELKLLKQPLVSLALINLWVLFATYSGMTLILSIWLTLYVRFTVIWVAVVLGVMVISTLLLTHIMRHYLNTHKVWIPFCLAIILLGISCFYTSNFNIDIDLGRLAISRILAGFSFALFLPSLLHLIMQNQPPDLSIKALTLFQITRASSSGLGATIFYTIWIRRQVFFYERLGGGLTEFSPITDQFFIRAKAFGLSKAQANPQLDEFLTAQATSLALNDCCYLMGWMTVLLLILFVISYLRRDVLYREQPQI